MFVVNGLILINCQSRQELVENDQKIEHDVEDRVNIPLDPHRSNRHLIYEATNEQMDRSSLTFGIVSRIWQLPRFRKIP
jgi:hypothetical protein